MRHRVGQLDSVKAVPYEELEAMRLETEARLKVLEEQYWGKRDKQAVSGAIRDKYKQYSDDAPATTPGPAKTSKLESATPVGILKTGGSESLAKPKFGGRPNTAGPGAPDRSRSESVKQRSPSPPDYSDPRQ